MKIRCISSGSYQEQPITGHLALWQPQQVCDIEASDAAKLVATGLFTYEDSSTYANQLIDHAAEHAAMGYIDASTYGASPSASAATNTSAIQEALSDGGRISLIKGGTYLVSDTLIYGSNTTFYVGPGVVIKQAPNTNKTLMMSMAHQSMLAGGSSVTLTQGSGAAVNVSWPGHNLQIGDGIWIDGAALSPSTYKGVFRVTAVTDANTVVVNTPVLAASAPSGAAVAVKATANFRLVGEGSFDYDYANNTGSPATYQAHCINLVGLLDAYIEGLSANNANKYAWSICATNALVWSNLRATNRSDGIKIYGPSVALRGSGVYGSAGDDFISLQTKESTAYLPYQPAFGDLFDIKVSAASGNNLTNGSLVVLYPSDAELFDKIEIDGVLGEQANATAVRIDCISPFTQGNIGSVRIRSAGALNNSLVQLGLCNVRELRIDMPRHNPRTLTGVTAAILVTGVTSVVGLTVIDGGRSTYPSSGNWSTLGYLAGKHGTIHIRNFIGDNTVANAQNWLQFAGAAWELGQLILDGCEANTGSKYLAWITSAPAAGVPIIILRNCRIRGSGAVDIATSGVNVIVKLEGNDFNGLSLAVVRVENTNTVAIKSDGANTFTTSAIIAVTAGSPTITIYGWDLTLDIGGVTGLGKTTSGMYCFNSGAGRGTIAQNRLVTCNGTNWVQVDNPTNVY